MSQLPGAELTLVLDDSDSFFGKTHAAKIKELEPAPKQQPPAQLFEDAGEPTPRPHRVRSEKTPRSQHLSAQDPRSEPDSDPQNIGEQAPPEGQHTAPQDQRRSPRAERLRARPRPSDNKSARTKQRSEPERVRGQKRSDGKHERTNLSADICSHQNAFELRG